MTASDHEPTMRREHDTLGEVSVPAAAYYGAATVRSTAVFDITGLGPSPALVRALATVKAAAATANADIGELDPRLAATIRTAAESVAAGELADQFLVEPCLGGAGTALHMNVNEVIANRANQLLGGSLGGYSPVHPNDHVNLGQSTNDVVPTAMRLVCLDQADQLVEELRSLAASFAERAAEFGDVIKVGRTVLRDALPISLGDEMEAYAFMVDRSADRLEALVRERLPRLAIGGTAIGTGFGAGRGFRDAVIAQLVSLTSRPLTGAGHLPEVMRDLSDFADVGSALQAVGAALGQIADDLRVMSSGPRAGLGEIVLPELEAGSSIMPGKSNPSVPEMITAVSLRASGVAHTVSSAVSRGQLELNTMTPLIASELEHGFTILTRAAQIFNHHCVTGLEADRARCAEQAEHSMGLAAALNPIVGYQRAAAFAKEAAETGRPLRAVVQASGLVDATDIDALLNPSNAARPHP